MYRHSQSDQSKLGSDATLVCIAHSVCKLLYCTGVECKTHKSAALMPTSPHEKKKQKNKTLQVLMKKKTKKKTRRHIKLV